MFLGPKQLSAFSFKRPVSAAAASWSDEGIDFTTFSETDTDNVLTVNDATKLTLSNVATDAAPLLEKSFGANYFNSSIRLRCIFNATGQGGTFSNYSGFVIADDVDNGFKNPLHGEVLEMKANASDSSGYVEFTIYSASGGSFASASAYAQNWDGTQTSWYIEYKAEGSTITVGIYTDATYTTLASGADIFDAEDTDTFYGVNYSDFGFHGGVNNTYSLAHDFYWDDVSLETA